MTTNKKETNLKVINSWERLSYSINGETVPPEVGGEAKIKWPDGEEEWVIYISEVNHTSVYDHGRREDVKQYILKALIEHKGLTFERKLEDLVVLDMKSNKV